MHSNSHGPPCTMVCVRVVCHVESVVDPSPYSPPPRELLCAAEASAWSVRARGWPGPRPEQSDGACPVSSVRALVVVVPLSSQSPDVAFPGTCRACPVTVTRVCVCFLTPYSGSVSGGVESPGA